MYLLLDFLRNFLNKYQVYLSLLTIYNPALYLSVKTNISFEPTDDIY